MDTSKLFNGPNITLVLKPDKDMTRKEYYKPKSSMNIDAKKILHKISANSVQLNNKGLHAMSKEDLFQECQGVNV